MYYDECIKAMARKDQNKIKNVEKDLNRRTGLVAQLIAGKYENYVQIFGITGAMARGEGIIRFDAGRAIGSDIDFAIVTKYISPRKERAVKNDILNIFRGCKIEPGALFFSPTIFKRPDLMFFEFVNSGRFLYGSIRFDYPATKIPWWEAVRLMTFRGGGPFFKEVSFEDEHIRFTEGFHYAFSKAILGCGESLLIIEGRYKANMKEREKEIMKSKIAGASLKKYYKLAMDYRRGKDSWNKAENEKLLEIAADILLDTWDMILDKLASKLDPLGQRNRRAVLKKISSPFPTILVTRGFYFLKYLKKGRIKIPLGEPFIEECAKNLDLLENITQGKYPEGLRREVVNLWRTAERFWLPI